MFHTVLVEPEIPHNAGAAGRLALATDSTLHLVEPLGFSLEDIRKWLLIYEHEGTAAQMREWIALADRQLLELAEQKKQLEDTIVELQKLRDETSQTLR